MAGDGDTRRYRPALKSVKMFRFRTTASCIPGRSRTTDVTIGDMVQIGHGAMIHARKIGNRVLIGMNATVLPGAEIGNNCIIGAGCVVPEMKVPEGSFMVGIPGKIKSKATAEQLGWVEDASREYTERGRQYKAEGL